MEPRIKRRKLAERLSYPQTFQHQSVLTKFYSPTLPLEMISKIYSYLSQSDVDNASHTCHQWLNAKQLYRKNYLKLHLNGNLITPFLLNYIIESERIVSKITLENIDENTISKNFWKNLYTEKVEELKFENCKISIYELVEILNSFPNLKKIEFRKCDEPFSQLKRKRNKCKQIFFNCFKNLTTFIIDNSWSVMKMDDFSAILRNMKNLKEFEIYLKFGDCLEIIEIIKKWNLTSLKFSGNISLMFQLKFFQEIKNLNLTVFQIKTDFFEFKVPFDFIYSFLLMQTNLREFGINVFEFTSPQLLMIMEKLKNLEKLEISQSLIFSVTQALVNQLNRLKCFNLGISEFIFMDAFFDSNNETLTHFTLRGSRNPNWMITGGYGFVIPLGLKFKNLTNFDLTHHEICGIDIQSIIKNLKNLEVLRIHSQHQLSDFAYTGVGKPLLNSELKNLCTFHRNLFQNDVYSSIASLTKLVELDIQTVGSKTGITDKSLYQIANLENLKKINLSNYQKITLSGIRYLVKNCRYLEQINITGCNEDFVKNIQSYLPLRRYIKIINS